MAAKNQVKVIITVDDKGTPVVKQFAMNADRTLKQSTGRALESARAIKTAYLGVAAAAGAAAGGATSSPAVRHHILDIP